MTVTRGTTLADMTSRNSIGFLRLIAATLVIVGHSFPFGGYGEDPLLMLTHNQVAIGRFPVDVFFALSGYLITMSYLRAGNPLVFAWHRFLRIYPALWACVIFIGVVLASIFGDGPDPTYVIRNSVMIVGFIDTIPGMFAGTPGHGSIDSSLWTLPWELRAYLGVFALGILGLLSRVVIVLPLFLATWALFGYQIFSYPGHETTSVAVTSGARLLTFFLAGTLFYLLRARIPINGQLAAAAGAILTLATVAGALWVDYSGGLFYVVAPLTLTYLVFWLAIRLPFQKINHDYDFSYGIYIYGTLGINVLAALHFNDHLPWLLFLALSLVLAAATAVPSWYLIEKPAQQLKDWRGIRDRAGKDDPAITSAIDP